MCRRPGVYSYSCFLPLLPPSSAPSRAGVRVPLLRSTQPPPGRPAGLRAVRQGGAPRPRWFRAGATAAGRLGCGARAPRGPLQDAPRPPGGARAETHLPAAAAGQSPGRLRGGPERAGRAGPGGLRSAGARPPTALRPLHPLTAASGRARRAGPRRTSSILQPAGGRREGRAVPGSAVPGLPGPRARRPCGGPPECP